MLRIVSVPLLLVGLLAGVFFSLGQVTPTSTAATAPGSTSDRPAGPARAASSDEEAARVADYLGDARAATNKVRVRHHRRQLTSNSCIGRAAERQAKRMSSRNTLFHSPDFNRLGKRCGLSAWGENVAQALPDGGGPDVVRQWMASAGHRANILNPKYRILGMGAVRRHGFWWVVQVFGRRF